MKFEEQMLQQLMAEHGHRLRAVERRSIGTTSRPDGGCG